MQSKVILVDEHDNELGLMDKMDVHKKGILHRAFSIFIFNSKGQLLLQQRADNKYHSSGLWSNTCCSHPMPGESIEDAAIRRLKEEMGMQCTLKNVFSFIYRANLDSGLIEHEYDYVFTGMSDEAPQFNKEEVKDWKYMEMDELEKDIKFNKKAYTAWLAICFPEVRKKINFPI